MQTANESAAQLSSVTKRFARTVALHDVDMTVPVGSVFGLIGANGAGKTSLLSVLATSLRPTSGTVQVLGIDAVKKPRAVRALVGVVPDEIGTYGDLRVEDHLRFYAGAYRVSPEEWPNIIDGLLELVDLATVRSTHVHDLSRGMRKRLSLARALVHDPELLILDEPATGLDPQAQADFGHMLQTLRNRGKTIIISSHDLSAIEQLCTHVAMMSNRQVLVEGPIATVCAGATLTEAFHRLGTADAQ